MLTSLSMPFGTLEPRMMPARPALVERRPSLAMAERRALGGTQGQSVWGVGVQTGGRWNEGDGCRVAQEDKEESGLCTAPRGGGWQEASDSWETNAKANAGGQSQGHERREPPSRIGHGRDRQCDPRSREEADASACSLAPWPAANAMMM